MLDFIFVVDEPLQWHAQVRGRRPLPPCRRSRPSCVAAQPCVCISPCLCVCARVQSRSNRRVTCTPCTWQCPHPPPSLTPPRAARLSLPHTQNMQLNASHYSFLKHFGPPGVGTWWPAVRQQQGAVMSRTST
jgi:hypothetical protein